MTGQLLLIDVAFAQVRPSPWRQAVDLGNMMLVLAVRADPARVYRQALTYFTEAELAEAFAATRGVASPTQLRAFMKRDPRDLLAEFRTLAPQRRPIVLQRWSARRVTLATAMLAIFAVTTVFGVGLLVSGQRPRDARHADVGRGPPRTRLRPGPCDDPGGPGGSLGGLPALRCRAPVGLDRGRPEIASGQASFVLNSAQAGLQSVTITLTATCDTSGDQQIPSDQPRHAPQRLDDAWLRLMVSGREPPLTVIAEVLNVLGLVYVTLPVRIALAGFLALRRRWWHLAAFAAAIVLSEVLIGSLKGIYDRTRPPGSLVATTNASFPSGHAIAASVTVVAAVIALVPPGRRRTLWGAAAVAFSIVMGLSRAYLAAHWLSDATAGILLGTSCALITALIADQFQRRQNRLQRPAGTQFLAGVPPAHHAEDSR